MLETNVLFFQVKFKFYALSGLCVNLQGLLSRQENGNGTQFLWLLFRRYSDVF